MARYVSAVSGVGLDTAYLTVSGLGGQTFFQIRYYAVALYLLCTWTWAGYNYISLYPKSWLLYLPSRAASQTTARSLAIKYRATVGSSKRSPLRCDGCLNAGWLLLHHTHHNGIVTYSLTNYEKPTLAACGPCNTACCMKKGV